MNPKRASKQEYKQLPKDERRIVFFARWANEDTWIGGCSAMRAAEADNQPSEAYEAVMETYGRSSGKVPDELDAWTCGECGSVHFGRNGALNCCAEIQLQEDLDLLSDLGL